MKRHLIFLFSTICLAVLAEWLPPSEELSAGVIVHPNPVSISRWLWFEAESIPSDTDCFYRCNLKIGDNVDSLEIICYFDDSGEIYLNGNRLVRNTSFQQKNLPMKAYNFKVDKAQLKTVNTLAIHVFNGKYKGGLFMLGIKHLHNGGIEYFHTAPAQWKAAPKEQALEGWFTPGFDDAAWKPAKDFGDAGVTPWATQTDVLNLCCTPAEKKQYAKEVEDAIVLPASLKDEPDHRMETVWKNGLPFWKVGNEEFPPVVMRTGDLLTSKYKNDILIKAMYSGTRVVECGINTRTAELGDGKYDFSGVDNNVRRLLKLAPDAYIMLHLFVSTMANWSETHPDENIGYATGVADNKITKIWHSLDVGGRAIRPSYASQPFLDELDNFVKQFADHIKQFPWYKRVVAMRTSYGCYSEWHYYGMAGHMPDTGKAMTVAFRKYLRNKYASEADLRAAWHDATVTFETATVPGVEERMGSNLYVRNPASAEKKVLDYYECHQEVVCDALLSMAGSAKKYMPKLQVGAFYGYVFGMGKFPSEGQTLAIERALASPNIDFLSSPYSYRPWARYMGGNGMLRTLPEIFKRHGKVALNELDIRTHLSCKADGFHNVETAAQSEQIFYRDILLSALSGVGVHITEMNGKGTNPSWFNAPEIFKAIHTSLDTWRDIRDNTQDTDNEIAVIFDYRELYRNGYPLASLQNFNETIGDTSLSSIYMSGYNFDVFSMQGFLRANKKYKTLVFLNAVSLDKTEREQLVKAARNSGSTVVWIYAPGLASEKGFSKEAMHELTGLELDYTLEKQPIAMTLSSGNVLGNPKLMEAPQVFVADKDGTALATYSNGTVAMAKKLLADKSTAIFSGVPITDAQMWASLFKEAGCTAISQPGVFVKYSKPYLLVHVGKAGNYDISLPDNMSKATNVLEKQNVPVKNGRISLQATDCKTWLLKLEE